MAIVTVNDEYLTDIADSIRSKLGVQTTYKPSEMAEAIESISGGGITPTGTKQISITENGTTTEDVTSYASAEITANVPNSYSTVDEGKVVSNGALVAQTSDTVTENDTYDTTLINSLTVNVSGGGSSNEVIRTVVVDNSVGNVTIDSVLSACENMGYTLTYNDCILKFRAKGANANSSPPNNYTYNNHTVLVKDGVVWNAGYNRCRYSNGAVSPDSFTGVGMYETNNNFTNSGNIIDSNHKIVNTFASATHGMGGSGTTVTLYEIPVVWSDFLTTL